MPELPEVETVKNGLQKLIVGLKITEVSSDNLRSFPNDSVSVDKFMIGARVLSVDRRAKVLLIHLSTKYSLMIHLKMTGQIVYVEAKNRFGAGHPNDSLISKLPDRSTRVTIGLDNGANLYFNDQRKFGWMKLLPTSEVKNEPFMLKVGPEPLSDMFTEMIFIERMRKRKNSPVKAALLDQTVLAGVGNIYADESLWAAMIHPAVRVGELSDDELILLRSEIVSVLILSIEKGGSTDRNYVNAEGKKGSYIEFAKVFRREGQPCKRCGQLIEKSRVAGRGTHTCPGCQPLLFDSKESKSNERSPTA